MVSQAALVSIVSVVPLVFQVSEVLLHCKNKRVVLTQLGYLSCSFTAKECTYKQIS